MDVRFIGEVYGDSAYTSKVSRAFEVATNKFNHRDQMARLLDVCKFLTR
jgi:hypothetical protein